MIPVGSWSSTHTPEVGRALQKVASLSPEWYTQDYEAFDETCGAWTKARRVRCRRCHSNVAGDGELWTCNHLAVVYRA